MHVYLIGLMFNYIDDINHRIQAMKETMVNNNCWEEYCSENDAKLDNGEMSSECVSKPILLDILHDFDLIYCNEFSWELAKKLRIVILQSPEKEWNILRNLQQQLY